MALHMLLLRTGDHVAEAEFYRAEESLNWWGQGQELSLMFGKNQGVFSVA